MLTDGSFYITLPSNTKQFSTNRLSSYRVRLPHRLQLEGPGWEVALVEAIYPHSWFNFTPDTNQKTSDLSVYVAIPFTDNENRQGTYTKWISIAIPVNHYSTAENLIDAINDQISLVTNQEYTKYVEFVSRRKVKIILESLPRLIEFDYDMGMNRVLLHANDTEIVQKIRMSPLLAYILGFDRGNHTILDKEFRMVTQEKKSKQAEHPPDMKAGLYALYIYCDIVENQIVGDSLVPLLAKVPILGEYNSVSYTVFNPPMYLPLLRQEIETVEVEIKDDANNQIPFQYGKVVLTLHFRRRLVFL